MMTNKEIVITTEPKSFHFDLPKDDGINLKHETDSMIEKKDLIA